MAGYIIVQVDVHDAETYEKYKPMVPPTLVPYGGEFVVRGGPQECVEGNWHPRTVVIRFADVATARAWYDSPEYAPAKALRHAAANANLLIVEGE